MTNAESQRAIVTGASSGVGAAVVRSLAASGRTVLAIARRESLLRELAAETGCRWLAADVRDIESLSDEVRAFAPDILVNNAGVGHGLTGIEGLDVEAIEEAFEINVVAPVQLTAVALEGMRERSGGHVVNLGSISGLHTLGSALYGGTKSAIHQFSQNLRFELRGTGIRVTEVCPGRVATGLYEAAAGDRDKLERMAESGIRELQPTDVAEAILFAVNAPSHVNVSTIELLPTEQAIGGAAMTPVPMDRRGE